MSRIFYRHGRAFVRRHGRDIEVELPDAASPRRQKSDPFAIVDLAPTAKAAAATNCPKLFVWLWLICKARTKNTTTIRIPNGALAEYGISRKVKYLALQQLEQAGLITVEWKSRKTPIVTLHP